MDDYSNVQTSENVYRVMPTCVWAQVKDLKKDKCYSLCPLLDDLIDSDTRINAYVLSLISSILY